MYWTEGMTAYLQEHLHQAESFTTLAMDISKQFNRAVSRNAVIGKAHRLGSGRRGEYVRPPGKTNKRKYRARNKQKPLTVVEQMLRVGGERLPRVIAKRTRPTGKGRLLDITEPPTATSTRFLDSSNCCMWPISNETMMDVCGAPIEIGAYCCKHAQLAYRLMPTIKRNRAFHHYSEFPR